ncbi:phenylalanine--tRNA ligase subunit alpha [Patescibacteria group bacterium]|nr:phenylalanine--tRNA ligase subunit alpha [Patescibacteria group bacterium]
MPFEDDIKSLLKDFNTELQKSGTKESLENLKNTYLGRKGKLSGLLGTLKDFSKDEKARYGKLANEVKAEMAKEFLEKQQHTAGGGSGFFDVTEPGKSQKLGHLHPYTKMREEVNHILYSMGFQILDGEEITSDYYCFESLNIPKGHPARDAWDTFYIEQKRNKNEELVLRTHTSSMQVAIMENQKPPLQTVVLGKCYRNEATDASHEHSFYQIEGFVVDETISVANMVSTLKQLLSAVFKEDVNVRLRPGFFPFVEPGYEMDMSCLNCKGEGCKVCKQSGWVELLGCGMIHPNVFKCAGYEPGKYTGYAFGVGFDRLTMMRYKIPDIRLFNSGDLRFIHQF